MARYVHLMTGNPHKLAEYRQRLSRYGLLVYQERKEHDRIPGWLEVPECVAVLEEESDLFTPAGERLEGCRALQVCENRTELRAWTRRSPEPSVYRQRIAGHVDLRRSLAGMPAGPLGPDVFGWDDIFVTRETGRSYQELRQRGLKHSARDRVISDFVQEHLWYERRIDLRWTPIQGGRPVDFSHDPVAFVNGHPLIGQVSGVLRRILDSVLAGGLFFRSAQSRREKIYWLPGLNAGLPLVPKRDGVHEATFLFHDLMHFAFPDLLPDGADRPGSRQVYVVHRMMSEACTLVLADMCFVEQLRRGGAEYDFAARRIHPLLAEVNLDPEDPEQLTAMLYASARLCLLGDERAWRRLGATDAVIAQFRAKYDAYFIADYHWTMRNYQCMSRELAAAEWLSLVRPLRDRLPGSMPTIQARLARYRVMGVRMDSAEMLLDACFGSYRERLGELVAGVDVHPDACRHHAFLRWLMGQMAIFVAYDFMPEARYWREAIMEEVAATEWLRMEEIGRIRGFYEQFLHLLRDRCLISAEDAATWAEVYPLFEPFYVDYDQPPGEHLEDVGRHCLEGEAP